MSNFIRLLPLASCSQRNVTISLMLPGNNPGDVKASSALEFVPRVDWVKFVDYYNSEKFLAKSKRNKENEVKLITPYTLGRTSMPIIHHKLAEERGTTDEEIGRVEVYIPVHTKKDKTIQCPDVIPVPSPGKGRGKEMQDNYGASGYFLETGRTYKRKHVETLKLTEVSASNKLESFCAS
ncbi:hypothetical protein GIB67_023798 [Kingdonia uniflora]|uniref:Uncharacterized protein n=1 Tax=Kingdonia uniflora TaxID=39325 RepID=A0A7J7NGS8_9MAGN|nr:hypothetical protein GIB67_023798 [Kingdonia uniflora]